MPARANDRRKQSRAKSRLVKSAMSPVLRSASGKSIIACMVSGCNARFLGVGGRFTAYFLKGDCGMRMIPESSSLNSFLASLCMCLMLAIYKESARPFDFDRLVSSTRFWRSYLITGSWARNASKSERNLAVTLFISSGFPLMKRSNAFSDVSYDLAVPFDLEAATFLPYSMKSR